MGFKCGIVGLPNVGKSTLFNALTKAGIDSENYPFCTIEPNVGIVPVNDPRLQGLASIVTPEKILPTTMEFVDIAGLVEGASKGEGLGNQFLSNIRETDAILHVVRCFENDDIIHVSNKVDPLDDVDTINTELALSDLFSAEKAYQKAIKNSKSGQKEGLPLKNLLEKILPTLEEGHAIRSLDFTEEEEKLVKGLQLLTSKPVLYVANVSEDGFKNNPHLSALTSYKHWYSSSCQDNALLVIEVVVLGFSTFVLFFVGLAAVAAGGFMAVGVVPESMLSALSSVGVLTALLAVLLWRPLMSMQGNVERKKVTSDLVGHSFILNEAVSMTKNPTYRYSGIDWNLSSQQELSAGTLVEVTGVAVGKFIVQEKAS